MGIQIRNDDRVFGYWNGTEGRVRDFYSSEDVQIMVGDLLVNVRELNKLVDELRDRVVALETALGLRGNYVT